MLRRGLVTEVVERQRQVGHVFANQRHGGLQVVALGAAHAHRIALDGGLHFDLAVFEQALNLFGHFGFNAIADFKIKKES